MNIVFIDNYDSFTFNLFQYFGEQGAEMSVFRNDAVSTAEIAGMRPDAIVISPGPGTPDDAGVSRAVIRELGRDIPILGVCLGMQCVAEVFGGRVKRAEKVMHGKTSLVHHDGSGIFEGLPNPVVCARYHSLIVDALPDCLRITAWTEDGVAMGIRHNELPIWGVQFHPESFLTDKGKSMIKNFMLMAERHERNVSVRGA
ncbi:MAG: Aminodeoxychorismate/anthranilate synthase component 2 [bacterium ADurb.Bin236]|nr:MAG: Aminodeoxychorismate/anthranilate synthase component 2 [bacterium ADurb.Bin236]HOY64777.1 aminodeoxychorismate/anthranilate synthase component II [bacterium]HPN93041.1 aminodeoxychorismate/anthranilate synthase component II [bacterium]